MSGRSSLRTPRDPRASLTVSAMLSPIQSRLGWEDEVFQNGSTAAVSANAGTPTRARIPKIRQFIVLVYTRPEIALLAPDSRQRPRANAQIPRSRSPPDRG